MSKKKYRITLYLGKENYEEFERWSKAFDLPIPTIVKALIDFGMATGQNAKAMFGEKNNAD